MPSSSTLSPAAHALSEHLFGRLVGALRQVPSSKAPEVAAFYIVFSLDEGGAFWPQIASFTWLLKYDQELANKEYGDPFSGWAISDGNEHMLQICDEKHDPRGFELLREFYREKCETDLEKRRWEHFEALWPLRWQGDAVGNPLRKAAELVLDEVGTTPEERRWLFQIMHRLVPFKLCDAFFEPLAAVIQQLHACGVIQDVCGRPVPIGVMATNDVGYQWGLEPTRAANPDGIAREVEEWMRAEKYATTAAREALEAEIALLPPQQQAQFWVQLTHDLFWLEDYATGDKKPTTLTDDLKKRDALLPYHLHLEARLGDLVPLAVPLLLSEIERTASNEVGRVKDESRSEADLAMRYFQTLAGVLLAVRTRRTEVDEREVARLEALMRRLWPEAKTKFAAGERMGYCLDYCARCLHLLRPEKYPVHRINPRKTAAFNFEDFGLL